MNFWDKTAELVYQEFCADRQNFLRYATIKSVMHSNQKHIVKALSSKLSASDISKAKDPDFGHPTRVWNGLSQSTMRSIYYYRDLDRILDFSSISHVTDFGAGYGNNCRVWRSLGYSGGYSLVDLPFMNEIQKYYLQNVLSDLNNINFIQTDRSFIPSTKKSIFFATFSLNETSLNKREEIESQILSHDYIFIHYNNEFPADSQLVDNIAYFNDFKNKNLNMFEFIEHINPQGKNILLGIKK